MANNFFNDSNKAYSENLNDGILVGNAFDWTVDVSLPTDTDGVFPDSSTIVMAKVADVSITPNSNLSIGSTIENNSSSSQVYRLTVYPNFNRFGGFKSISLTADSGVTFYIANKGGTSPIASNLDYDDLSNVPELKVLKEYDIVITIPMNKEVTGLEFVFQSSSADVSGSISQSNVTGLNNTITAIQSKDNQQDNRLTELESADENIFNYNLLSDYYNVQIGNDIIINCIVTDVNGEMVKGKTLTLYQNSSSVGTATTNDLGVAYWTVTCDDLGLQNFRVENQNIQVKVTGWEQVATTTVSGVTYTCSVNGEGLARVRATATNVSFATGNSHEATNWIPTDYKPSTDKVVWTQRSLTSNIGVYLFSNGTVGVVNTYSSTQTRSLGTEIIYTI